MTDDGTEALVVDGVSKRFGQFYAIRDVSFDVERGEFVGLFGPNGAGKSTLLRTIASLSVPTEGAVYVDGDEVTPDNHAVRRSFGVLTHDTMLYDGLSAEENLRLHARLHGVADVDARCAAVLDTVGLTSRAHDRPATFSHGLRKRLSLARALLHDPPVLLLDEPYSGLDRRAATRLEAILDDVDDRTVLLTTHDLERGFDQCSRAVMLDRGEVQADVETATLDGVDAFVETYERTAGRTR
jgi:heme exporter protein A